jgi:hypothetical protein
VILDDATSEIYYAQLVEEESTVTVMAGLQEVIERKGMFCALRELGIQMIPAYSPQARGRSERSFGTWQGRLPQELRLAGIKTREAANDFLRTRYVAEFNRRFAVRSEQTGTAFMACRRPHTTNCLGYSPAIIGFSSSEVDSGPLLTTCWRGDAPSFFATARNPDQQTDGGQRDQKVDDSALVMKSSRQESPVNARCQHRKYKDPEPILSD